MENPENSSKEISRPLIALMKGVVFRDKDVGLWQALEDGQIALRDYVRVMGLKLMIDESEGHAWLATRQPEEEQDPLPRLVGRRKLSYPVSLIIALLRKKLAENDASGEDPRLILSVEDITDMVKVFFASGSNEARLTDKIDSHLNKIADLGFIRRLKGQQDKIEVIRILKAFVDAQWLNSFDQRLREYRGKMEKPSENPENPQKIPGEKT